ncbi:MAG: rRNA pseudouridine synthase [Fibrobacter sp.]|nr:rRNA pseudouridine synthase [Fibrobacter sp.]
MFRVDRILSNLGYCSRRQAADFLRCHTVNLDGIRIKDCSQKADSHHLTIDGKPLDHPDELFLLMNKPAGYVCSHDPADGRLVYELLPSQWMQRIPVPSTIGRLDKDTTGVLLITDHTGINHALSSPRRHVDKVYEVTVDNQLSDDLIIFFSSGTLLIHGEEKPCLPAKLEITGPNTAKVTLQEGKYHQVKRMFQACGYKVTALHRSRFGIYTVDDIAPGEYREIPVPDIRN